MRWANLNNHKYKLLLILVTLFLYSCTSGGGGTVSYDPTGNNGVLMRRVNPENKLQEGDSIRFNLVFSNPQGPITSCHYAASTNGELLGVNGNNNYHETFTLQKRNENKPEGYSTSINLDTVVKELKDPLKDKDTQIIHNLCCDYNGVETFQICIDRNPVNDETNKYTKECNAGTQGQSLSAGCQGGPVCLSRVVSKFVPLPSQNTELQLDIYFTNQKRGEVMSYGNKETVCSGRSFTTDVYGTVSLTELNVGGYTLSNFDCGKGTMHIYDSYRGQVNDDDEPIYPEEKITCRIDLPPAVSIETPLTIQYQYGYKTEEIETLTIFDKNTRMI